MALILIEGFDNTTAAEVATKGWSGVASSMNAGRFTGQSAGLGNAVSISKPLPSTYATLFLGIAWKPNAGNLTNVSSFFNVQASTGSVNTFRLGCDGSAHLRVLNSGGTVIATGTTILSAGTWYYLEMKAFVNGASGSVEVHLNGATEIASTVANFGSTNLDTLNIASPNPTGGFSVDDIYICDTSGSTNTTFLGDVRVNTIYPSGAGTHTQWTPLTGSNWSEVSEAQADGDTSYNFDSNVGDIDSFVTAGIDAASTVYGLQTNLYARKDDTGTRQIAPLIRQASTDYPGTTVTLGSTYSFFTQIYNQDPTPANWTAANVNADEFGYKLIA